MNSFEGAKLYKLFSTPVVAVCLQRDLGMDEILASQDAIKERDIYALRKMPELEIFVTENVKRYRDNILRPREKSCNLRVTTSFARNGPDAHPVARFNSHTSGLLFLRATEGKDFVRFISPKERGIIYIPTYAPDDLTVDVCEIGTGSGYLFLFPSTIKYQVVGRKDIIYVGFNAFPTGLIGDEDDGNSVTV